MNGLKYVCNFGTDRVYIDRGFNLVFVTKKNKTKRYKYKTKKWEMFVNWSTISNKLKKHVPIQKTIFDYLT